MSLKGGDDYDTITCYFKPIRAPIGYTSPHMIHKRPTLYAYLMFRPRSDVDDFADRNIER